MALHPGEPFGRYRIEALLGEGGMGQVYRATDERLRRQVALKIIYAARDGGLGGDTAERLLREARAAAAIDHPNAVAIFDVGEVDGIPFLAMELVLGSTLRPHVEGNAPLAQRLHWLLAIARALAAAHRRGLIHRDIKPENVMVREDGLAKVLDFGIARPTSLPGANGATKSFDLGELATRAASPLSIRTGDSAAVGTPLYMSPEQLGGAPLDGRSDQFSWGVVAWELLAGKIPWSIENGAPIAMTEILGTDPGPIRSRNPEVSGEVEEVVARALSKRAQDRYETTDALVIALERATGASEFSGTSASTRTPSVSPMAHTVSQPAPDLAIARTPSLTGPTRRRAVWVGAIAAVTVAIGVGVGAWRVRGGTSHSSDDTRLSMLAPGRRPAVAVLAEAGKGGADARLVALPELLATELATGDQIRVVPHDVVARTVGTKENQALAAPMIAKLHAVTSADAVIIAHPDVTTSGKIHLDVRLSAIAPAGAIGETTELSLDGTTDDLPALVARAGTEVRRVLGRAPLAPEQAAALRAALPRTNAAAQAYAEGILHRGHYEYDAARAAFERAIAAEDDFALAHLELARSLANLGFDKRAREEAARALELSARLGREERLVIEAQHAATTKDWASAAEAYRTLFGFFPDNLDYGLAFVRSQVLSGKRDDALATLTRIRAVPRSAIEEARVDAMEAFVASKRGDVKRRLALASEAKRKADALGATWISADARVAIAEAHKDLGEASKGVVDLEEARVLYEQLGDKSGLALVYRQLAQHAELRGDAAEVRALQEQALALAREVGDRYRIGDVLTCRAIAQAHAGELAAAEKGFDEARAIYEKIQDIEGVAHNTGNAAEMRLERGELTGSRSAFERALALHTQIGMKMGIAGQTLNVAWATYFEGDLATAADGTASAVQEARAIDSKGQVWEALTKQGHVMRARGDAAGAARVFAEAAELATKAGDLDAKAEIELAEARLALDRGAAAEATKLARGALERFVKAKFPQDETFARAVLVRALVRAGNVTEATPEGEALEETLPKCELFEARFEARLAAIDLAVAQGDAAKAQALAHESLVEVERAGFVPLILEARLTEARLMRGTRRVALLAKLESDARTAGFMRDARLAH